MIASVVFGSLHTMEVFWNVRSPIMLSSSGECVVVTTWVPPFAVCPSMRSSSSRSLIALFFAQFNPIAERRGAIILICSNLGLKAEHVGLESADLVGCPSDLVPFDVPASSVFAADDVGEGVSVRCHE